jgi:poly(A) polymerase
MMPTNEIIERIALAFDSSGYEIYEVGGSVRDKYLNRVPNDFDFTTNARPDITEKILERLNIGSVFTIGKEYGTIGLMCGETKIEITTYRGEVYAQNSRKPNVVFGGTLYEDLSRRDFTIGAIAVNAVTKEVVDPFNGAADIAAKELKLVGGAERLAEDPLRMLRAIRFAVQLDFGLYFNMPEPERLQFISPERIAAELEKILLSPYPERGISLLKTYKLIPYVIPEFVPMYDMEQGVYHYKDAYKHTLEVLGRACQCTCTDKRILMLAALLHDIGKPRTKVETTTGIHFNNHAIVGAIMAEKRLKELHFDSDTVTRVAKLVALHMTPLEYSKFDGVTDRHVLRFVRKVGENDVRLLITLAKCDTSASRQPRVDFLTKLDGMITEALKEKPSEIVSPITGDEIMARFNLKPSKKVGEIKDALVEAIIDGKLERGNKERAFEIAQELINAAVNISIS